MKNIQGIIPPVVTPFYENGAINETLLSREMQICVDAGVHGLSVGGSTGEGPTLRYIRERQEKICQTRNRSKLLKKKNQTFRQSYAQPHTGRSTSKQPRKS